MWRVLMAVMAGAILAQVDFDADRGANGACAEEGGTSGTELLAPAASTKTPCKCVPRCKPHETCTTYVRDPTYCFCAPRL